MGQVHHMTEDDKKRAGLAPYCPCGSGQGREAHHDARGIFLCYACDDCRLRKMYGYRHDVLMNAQYECDEQIEED